MRLFLACYLVLVSLTAVLADDHESAQTFLKNCTNSFGKVLSPNNNHGPDFCATTLRTVMILGPFLDPTLKFCSAGNSPIMAMLKMSKYLSVHPEKQEEDYISAIVESLRDAWPCK
jgi:hypothetical protein